MSVVFENPENILELIKSANSFHRLTCSELMNCDPAIAWFRNINCPEFKTATEVFRWSLDRLLGLKINNPERVKKNFMDILKLLISFNIPVLAFAAPFFSQEYNRILEKISNFKSKNKIAPGYQEVFEQFMWKFAVHLILNLCLIVTGALLPLNLFIFLFIAIFAYSIYLIWYLVDRTIKLIFEESRNVDDENLINKLDQLMSLEEGIKNER